MLSRIGPANLVVLQARLLWSASLEKWCAVRWLALFLAEKAG